jgi:hypothetical protein
VTGIFFLLKGASAKGLSSRPAERKDQGMAGEQLDLFAADGWLAGAAPELQEGERLRPAEMDDGALLAALPTAGLRAAPLLAAEAARRRLGAAVPALERLCRRLTGFGAERAVPEQAAALEALQVIGGERARNAVGRIIADRIVQGPTLLLALRAAPRLGTLLPPARLNELLRDPSRSIRAAACRCAYRGTAVVEPLLALLDDADPGAAGPRVSGNGQRDRAAGCRDRRDAGPRLVGA